MRACRSLPLRLAAVGEVGLAEVGPDHAGVGPGGCVLRELGEELDAALDEQRAGLLQPHGLAAVAHVALRVQQEVLHLSICNAGGHRRKGQASSFHCCVRIRKAVCR